jgi:hypothetical protein
VLSDSTTLPGLGVSLGGSDMTTGEDAFEETVLVADGAVGKEARVSEPRWRMGEGGLDDGAPCE